jgi:archaellum biogenesis ATPase FlaH
MERVETTILKNLLLDDEFTRKVIPFLKSEYFQDRVELVTFEAIAAYVDKYNAIPTIETISIDLGNDTSIGEEDLKGATELIKSFDLDNYIKPQSEWLSDETENFCQDKAVYNAIMESIQILDGSHATMTKEGIPEVLNDALAISFDTHVGHDFIEDSDERFAFYHKKDAHIPLDLEMMNTITNGGVVNKTLNVLLGGTGAGKTLAMTHFASAYLMEMKNVLYITLEMAEERISERIDANLLNVPLDDLVSLPKDVYDKKIAKVKKKTTGKLIVKEFPTASAGVGHFRHLLNELALKKNFVPDVILIDYINICCSSRLKAGANVNSYTLIKAIAEEFRGFAVERNVPIWTATQVNREGFGNSDIDLTNTAESFGLPATADLFLAIITSEEMDQLNQIMMKQLKNRYRDEAQDRRFVVGREKAKMRLYDVEQTAQKDITQDDDVPAFDKSTFGRREKEDKGRFSQIDMG